MILIETEEDIRRAKLFSDSANARWRSALSGRSTPALMYFKTREPGKFKYVYISWSKETEPIEDKAIAELEKMTQEEGVYNGSATGEAYWLGVPYSEMRQFQDDQYNAARIHHTEFDRAVKILRDAISRIEVNVDPKYPPIGELYFLLAHLYFDHDKFEEHDAAYEIALSFGAENLEARPNYFGYAFAEKLKKLAHSYLYRDQLTPALAVYARLKHARSLVPKAVAAVMYEDWNVLAEFYKRHKQVDEAAACYRSIGEQIDWTKGPEYEQWETVRNAASSLIELGKHADAERIYEQLLEWGLANNQIKTDKDRCFHSSPCGHWFEPYFEMLLDQNRMQHRTQLFDKLGMDEAQYLPPKAEELIGYVDLDGHWKIPQRFEKAANFRDGTAEVLLTSAESTHARSRLIDTIGKLVGVSTGLWNSDDLFVLPGFMQSDRVHQGLFPVTKKPEKKSPYPGDGHPSSIGFADENGKLVIEQKFTEARGFYRDVAIVAIGGYIGGAGCVISLQDGKYGLIDRTGKYLIEPEFSRLGHYNEEIDDGLFTYRRGSEGGVITKDGEIRSVLPGCNDVFSCSDGMAPVAWGPGETWSDQKYGYLDSTGRVVIEPQFEHASSFVGALAPVRLDKKYGFINRKGEMVIDAIYDNAETFKNDLAAVEIGKRWGCIDVNGAFIVQALFDKIEWTKDDLLLVTQNEKLGLIDRTGKVICPAQFAKIDRFVDGFATVTLHGLKGMIDRSGALTIKAIFQDLKTFSEHLACAAITDDNGSALWGYIDSLGNFAVAPSFSKAESFSEGLAAVQLAGTDKWGFISANGEFAIEPQFDSADSFHEGRARISFGAKDDDRLYGIIDSQGKYVLAAEYGRVGQRYYDGLCPVGKKKSRNLPIRI